MASRERRAGRAGPAGRARRADTGGRYGLLLLVLIATYLLAAFSGARLATDLQIGLIAAVVGLALRTSPLPGRWPALIATGTVAGSAAAVGAVLTGTQTGAGLAELWKAFMLLLSAVLIVRRVLARSAVTIQSIYGALSAYLVAGLMFAACYAAMQHLSRSPFFAHGQPSSTQTFQYFSFTTLTTLGYGDFTAAMDAGRAVAVLEALTGQVYLATLVARLVASYRSPDQRDNPATGRPPPRRRPATRTVASSRSRLGRPPRRSGDP
jgi:hypothetical protein